MNNPFPQPEFPTSKMDDTDSRQNLLEGLEFIDALRVLVYLEGNSRSEFASFCRNLLEFEERIEQEAEKMYLEDLEKSASVSELELFFDEDVEPMPSHASVSDILKLLPYQWIGQSHVRINHTKERFVQYEICGLDSNGNFVPINPETGSLLIGGFDDVDKKILITLFMLTMLYKGEKFRISGKYFVKAIADNRKATKATKDRAYLSIKDKLDDFHARLQRYKAISLLVNWHEGSGKNKERYNLTKTGLTDKDTHNLALFLIPDIWYEDGDLRADIIPGTWYELYCKSLKQFTWIPKELLELDTYKHGRRFRIGLYLLLEYRVNRLRLKDREVPVAGSERAPRIKVLHRKLNTLLKFVVPPEELASALSTSYKGCRLKQGIIKDFEYYQNKRWFIDITFPEGGFKEFQRGSVEIAPRSPIWERITEGTKNKPARKQKPAQRKQKADLNKQLEWHLVQKVCEKMGWVKQDVIAKKLEISQSLVSQLKNGKVIGNQTTAKFRKILPNKVPREILLEFIPELADRDIPKPFSDDEHPASPISARRKKIITANGSSCNE